MLPETFTPGEMEAIHEFRCKQSSRSYDAHSIDVVVLPSGRSCLIRKDHEKVLRW